MKDRTQRALAQEQSELGAIINKGITFSVKDTIFETEKRFFGLVKVHKPKQIERQFTIEELTLATLDRLSAEWIELAIDEEALKDDDSLVAARNMASKHALRLARVVAIAVLGEDRLIAKPGKGGARWIEDKAKINELATLFARCIKPSQLFHLVSAINVMCNLGDFMNSIRLQTIERTTMPIRIEGNED